MLTSPLLAEELSENEPLAEYALFSSSVSVSFAVPEYDQISAAPDALLAACTFPVTFVWYVVL